MDDDQQFCLRWNNHQSTLISVFDTLLENETLVDCTLAAEGKFLKAHKVVLSACSPYFATLLQEQYDKHPIFILKDVKYQELRAMMDYMYRGEVNISQDQLAALLKAAESLQIKGLSDNRTGGGAAPKPESSGQQHHRGKLSGAYTLEQTKRARLATGGAMDTSGDVSGSREGSSSPSRRRRKVRRRSMENDAHDNSNSSVLQAAASNQSILQQTGAGLAVSALVSTQLSSGPAAGTSSSQASSTQQQQQQPLTSTNVTKKTESAKLTSSTAAPASGASASAVAAVQQAHLQQHQQAQATSDAINTENVQAQSQGGAQGVQGDDEDMDEGSAVGGASTASGPNPASASASAVHAGVVVKQLASVVDKSSSNHKQKIKDNSVSSVGSEMVIEPKAEYDDDAHDENVEDLTLDEEDMTMEELDQTAGTSQGGEGSSQTYATWQHDRSQDELGLLAQDAQQRDPQDLKYDYKHSVFGSDDADPDQYKERFHCAVCNKSYLRKRHLQRHMRDECIGIPPRFNCEFCSSRFRRKYHMVRHLVSKHGIPPAIAQMTTGSGSRTSGGGSLDLKSGGGLAGLQQMGGSGGGGSSADCGASVGSAGSHNGCESPIPENLSLRKENYENENLPGSRCTSPLPPHIMPIPTYGLTGAITAISAAAAVVEEQAAAAAAAAAAVAEAQAKNNNESGGGGRPLDADEEAALAAQAEAAAALGIKPEPVTPSKVQHLMNEEWNMKLGLQIISNSLLKERLMNTMPFAYNNN
ncbi:longitudinals lacking protein, isoforms H/M/V isoform X6 [Drosophila biarmipes]|uniref:longitudinals lacking protein, isoforms H/M/V isoform X6 n=1 Tax=Drosophila biarmipes TaxID=125945 RepID=UPI0007E65141|nr:longitudinals lacking protein, isoforms H/M/V isoform X6 [Drosophila biarmipes]